MRLLNEQTGEERIAQLWDEWLVYILRISLQLFQLLVIQTIVLQINY